MVLQLHSVVECSQCFSGENRLVVCCAVSGYPEVIFHVLIACDGSF